jgi:ribosome-associated protein
MSDTTTTLARAYHAIDRKKGEQVNILDVRGVSSFTDFFIICQGANRRQNQAICDEIVETLKKKSKLKPLHVEGYDHAEWILIDYIDLVVHIFSGEARQFYKIEKLWSDGVQIEPQAISA